MSIMNTITKHMCSFKITPYLVILLLISIIMVICVHSYVPLNNNHTEAEISEDKLCPELANERRIILEHKAREEEFNGIISCVKNKCFNGDYDGFYDCIENMSCAGCMNECMNGSTLDRGDIIRRLRNR